MLKTAISLDDDGCEWKVPRNIVCFTTNCDSINELRYEPIEETLLLGSNNVGVTLKDCIKRFNLICRYSSEALSHIDACQKERIFRTF